MKASETRLLQFIRKAQQFAIPIYQRNYSWTEAQCAKLWQDIIAAGGSEEIKSHFIGSIVYIEDGLSSVSSQAPLLVIDGQQRLTTISLLLAALRDALAEEEPLEGFNSRKISAYYLINEPESGSKRYKLALAETDRDSLFAIMGAPEPKEPSEAIQANFKFFQDRIAEFDDLKTICLGLEKLVIVDVALSRGQDNPQLIFESMNSTGLDLSQADLIRNYLLMDLPHDKQEHLYLHFWRPMERDFGQRAYQTEFDPFIRHFLSFKMGEIPRQDNVYNAFKDYFQQETEKGEKPTAIISELRKFASHYCKMALGRESDPELANAFSDLVEIRANTAFPMLLEWYDDYTSGLWTKKDLLAALRLTESYIWRRAVCGMPTNSLNKTFLIFNRNVNKSAYLESVTAAYLLLSSYKRFPKNDEFKAELQTRNLYVNRAKYWIRKLENFGHKEPINMEDYSIEHIMPQNKRLSPSWQKELGPDWEAVHGQWLHTLGNLTLTGYNSEYSDRSFKEKKDMPHGFRESHLFLNKGLEDYPAWNESAIKDRAAKLSQTALQVWARPELDKETLLKYAPRQKAPTTGYSLADHPKLLSPSVKPLYEALRKAILDLEPSVTEEFLKLYIAYKADTNFVDVTPLASSLRLTLNMEYHDLNDPKQLARDLSNVNHWGNGNVEIKFAKLEQLPDIIDLVRQALEKQLNE